MEVPHPPASDPCTLYRTWLNPFASEGSCMFFPALKPPYRLLIVDDHRFLVEMLAQRLALDHQVRVVGVANHGPTAVQLVTKERVDIVLLDMELEEADGIGIAKQMLEVSPELRIIGLSMHDDDHHPFALLEIGGAGFISKHATAREISEAIRRVAVGEIALTPQIAVHLATQGSRFGTAPLLRLLTPKELELLGLLARGYSVKEIAQHAGISGKTVQTHRNSLRRKLNARTDVDLCLLAIRAGLIDPSSHRQHQRQVVATLHAVREDDR